MTLFLDTLRRRHFTQLCLVFLAAMLLRMILGRAINGPSIFTDELQYIEMARSLPLGRGLFWDNTPTFYPCWLYPLIIAPFVNLLPWDSAYPAIRGLGAILMAMAVFPAYGLARELADHRRALAAAVLVALLAGAGYSPTIMTENLFLPVFTLAVWASWRGILHPTRWRRLAAGLACGLAFHVKPHGMILPPALAATVLIFEADRLRGQGLAPRAWLSRTLRGIGRHWLTALGWVLAVSPRLFVVHYYEHQSITLGHILGSYTSTAEGTHTATHGALALSFAGYLLVWAWCAGLLPAWLLARRIYASLAGRDDPPTRLLVLLTVVVTAAMAALISRHTLVNNPDWRVHERYLFVVLPLVLVLFCARARILSPAGSLFALYLFVALVPFHVWLMMRVTWTLPTSAPSFTGFLLFIRARSAGPWLIALYLLPALVALGLLFTRPVGFGRQFAVVGLLFFSFNIGWYGVNERLLNPSRRDDLNTARKAGSALGGQGRLLVLKEGMRRNLTWQAGIRNPGLNVALSPASRSWWEELLQVDADGRVRAPLAEEDAWLLASNTWKFNRAPDDAFTDSAVYHLGGPVPLRLDANQLLAYRENLLTTAALASGISFLAELRLGVVGKRLPAAWIANAQTSITLKLRNESSFTLPGGTLRLGLASVWIRPPALGADDAVTTGARVSILPEWIEPGQELERTLQLRVPANPGKGYTLAIKPFVDLGGSKDPRKKPKNRSFWLENAILTETLDVQPSPQR